MGIKRRLEAMSQPLEHSAEEEIWEVVRSWLIIIRIISFIAMIAVAEMLDEVILLGLSVSLWALISGIPLFLILSLSIIWGDRYVRSLADRTAEELVGMVDRRHGRETQVTSPGIDAGRGNIRLHPIHKRH